MNMVNNNHHTSTPLAMRTTYQRDLIYDAGMHMGEDTEYYLEKNFRVIGFEANPELVQICRDKFADYITNGRLVILEGAIVEPDGRPDTVDFCPTGCRRR